MTAGLWYSVAAMMLVGVGILGFCLSSVAGGSVPEITEGRRDIWFHIAAEVVTGTALLVAAALTVAHPEAGDAKLWSAVAFGLLVYTLIQSPGYYVDHRDPVMLGMFGGIWLITLPAIVLRFL